MDFTATARGQPKEMRGALGRAPRSLLSSNDAFHLSRTHAGTEGTGTGGWLTAYVRRAGRLVWTTPRRGGPVLWHVNCRTGPRHRHIPTLGMSALEMRGPHGSALPGSRRSPPQNGGAWRGLCLVEGRIGGGGWRGGMDWIHGWEADTPIRKAML
jgi:hypothetical protein